MIGGMRPTVISPPFSAPQPSPVASVASAAQQPYVHRRSAFLPPAPTAPASPPTDRSIPPVMITAVIPTDMIPIAAASVPIVRRFDALANSVLGERKRGAQRHQEQEYGEFSRDSARA